MTDAPQTDRPVSWAVVVLVVLATLGMLLGIILAVSSTAIPGYEEDADTTKAALTLWAAFSILLGVVALVGAVVVAGVRSFLRRAGLPV